MQDFEKTFTSLVDGELPDSVAAVFLRTLSDTGEDRLHLVAAARILLERSISLPSFPGAVDLCGTGGDGGHTVNVSTAASFVVAACGIPVAKHGNRAASSRSGSTDVLQALGLEAATSPSTAEKQFDRFGIAFISAPAFHPALARLAPLRRILGRRTIFNLLGPLINPARVLRQLVGVYHPDWLVPFANALRELGSGKAWVVHGDSLDELTVTGINEIAILQGQEISRMQVDPTSLHLGKWTISDLRGGDPEQNAALMQNMLNGSTGAYRDITIMNAGAALVVAGKVEGLVAGTDMARDCIDSGAALDLLHRMRQH